MNDRIHITKIDKHCPINVFKDMADIHRNEIGEGFLTTLGERFLTALYRSFARSKNALIFAAFNNDRVVGFICGSITTKKVYLDVLLSSFILYMPLIAFKLFTPKKIYSIFETLFYPKKDFNKCMPESEILNFCVDTGYQKKGLGLRLFNALMKEYADIGINSVKIITGLSQKKAQSFYEAVNARLVQQIEIHKNVKSLIYLYTINGH